jgi:hypothetical protein
MGMRLNPIWSFVFVLFCGLAEFRLGAEEFTRKPLKVFILAGQSNMQGHAHVRTLEHLSMQSETKSMLGKILNPDGSPKTYSDVFISYRSSDGVKVGALATGFGATSEKIGPELTFGITMAESLNEPILLIKAAWGGKSLHTDFRPPSAGPFVFTDAQKTQWTNQKRDLAELIAEKEAATGVAYREMIEHVRSVLRDIESVHPKYDPQEGYELAGFVWFQGWNDMVDSGVYPNRDQPGGYDAYSQNLACLIRDVRKDLQVPELPFVIGVMGVGGPTAEYGPGEKRYAKVHQNFRDAMLAPTQLPEFKGRVRPVLTEQFWDSELTRLRTKEADATRRAKERAKQENLDAKQLRALEEEYRLEALDSRERKILEVGVSNAEFHYLGSARILGQIGEGMAKAMLELQ